MGGARLRWGLLAASLAASVGVTALLWWLTGSLWAFVLVAPFLFAFPLSAGKGAPPPPARRCPQCGFATTDPDVRFCPRHGPLG